MSARTFLLPDLGEGLTEAEIVRWLVDEGDVITVDQPVAEVETAKAVIEVPSPHAGKVTTRHAAEGTTLDVGAPLITVAAPDAADTYREEERAGSGNVLIGYGTSPSAASGRRRRPRGRDTAVAPAPTSRPATVPAPPSRPAAVPVQPAPPKRPAAAPLVLSPLVRRLARENGVDLSVLHGTGPGGVITRRDVESATRTPEPATPAAGERRVPLSGFRKAVSAVLTRSRAEIPEATVWVDVDATALWELRERTRGDAGSPGLMSYVARFVVAGLREYPVFNARLDTERQEIVELPDVNLGLAVQTDRGLVVPAVMGAQTMTTTGLDAAIRDVTARARRGESTPAELTAGTFTLNNYGAFRVDGSAAIINHPQVAMLGLGRVIDRPWVVSGALAVRKIAQLSFVFDHRVCDGGAAAGFIRSVADAIEDPPSALARL
ncbi:pyruvate dehydrogenase E2 component (dihydrolipoamide acetyltransferase) [Actinoplanes campanulatus]|uniref:Dihydrolipoamide acetyltransferase component of pyruvate dehydrogenase complex n=1 Tax=Actinoplanes campanulatus TaxID=113559 RepID=A0A7W5FGY6_9ACTN|nr:dihydrolipoamide acetyltransferase family protein [Actinoplanes campanulatus]MBB3098036.1 pyruvate dehydrogenase E2 component (dihydrolipoamide acetyltransferase) [Actinoplanes campanulatus]GGN32046.1 dihydrolipoamide acetyltransferase component of pyruvate dehydrogenase complex [Actinoplanes campanulatus]GID40092.1 dihydrolipoamide acetyltransferase component of pyruvate dehydrogenase complex [Actinoplanes campanulatus]